MKSKPRQPPFLTRAESELMRVLWAHGPATIHDVAARLDRPLAYTTVLTLMRILEQKGYAAHAEAPGGRAHLYRAAVEPGKVRRRHVRDLVERLFGGRTDALLAGLIEDEKLSPQQLAQLRQKIDERLGSSKRRPS